MQKQDKDLYKQLLGLQESIQGLKVELKRERDECEEAFRDLQEISSGEPTENRQTIQTKPTEQQTPRERLKDKPSIESESNMEAKSWKHDRQDSGISVKNCEVESSGELMRNDAVPSSITPASIIRHSKQDSGILLGDETAESETKLLSRLVQSSREFFKTDNGKLHSAHNRLRQVVEQGVLNKKLPNRSMSSNDLSKSSLRPIRDPNSRPIIPMHSHSKSCPSTLIKRFNQESCQDYKVVPLHHVRPTQRSASVVNLHKLDKKDSNVSCHSLENGIRSNVMAKSEPNLVVGGEQAKPLRAVLVSACEVSVSNTRERRENVSRQSSQDGRMGNGVARTAELQIQRSQRRFTVLGLKPERPFHDSKLTKQFNTSAAVDKRDSGYFSPSLQFPRNHVRHRTMPEHNDIRRRHSLNIFHASSKSWDGNMARPRELTNLLRSSSQVSLV